jgi:HK97 family phage major capsid protein
MSDDPKALLGQLQAAFEEFKTANEKKLNAKADVVLTEKVERISASVLDMQATIDEQARRLAAAQVNGTGKVIADPEYTAAFTAHIRKGDIQANLNKGASDEGGYLAPTEWDRSITDELVILSPMRSICSVQTVSVSAFSKLFNLKGMASGWVGEAAARTETNTPTFGSMTITPGELYANPAATQQMLDDAQINLEALIGNDVAQEFAYQEGVAFVTGNGTNKPNGVTTYVTGAANAAANPLGAIAVTTATGTADNLTEPDDIISLIYALPSEMTANARFIMNRATMGVIMKLQDSNGNYLWQPALVAGQPSQLRGFPVTEIAAMPDINTGDCPILFGNFQRGYQIVDRAGVRMLRDPFTNKPYVHFYTTKRVGGAVVDPQALKALKIN